MAQAGSNYEKTGCPKTRWTVPLTDKNDCTLDTYYKVEIGINFNKRLTSFFYFFLFMQTFFQEKQQDKKQKSK